MIKNILENLSSFSSCFFPTTVTSHNLEQQKGQKNANWCDSVNSRQFVNVAKRVKLCTHTHQITSVGQATEKTSTQTNF